MGVWTSGRRFRISDFLFSRTIFRVPSICGRILSPPAPGGCCPLLLGSVRSRYGLSRSACGCTMSPCAAAPQSAGPLARPDRHKSRKRSPHVPTCIVRSYSRFHAGLVAILPGRCSSIPQGHREGRKAVEIAAQAELTPWQVISARALQSPSKRITALLHVAAFLLESATEMRYERSGGGSCEETEKGAFRGINGSAAQGACLGFAARRNARHRG